MCFEDTVREKYSCGKIEKVQKFKRCDKVPLQGFICYRAKSRDMTEQEPKKVHKHDGCPECDEIEQWNNGRFACGH